MDEAIDTAREVLEEIALATGGRSSSSYLFPPTLRNIISSSPSNTAEATIAEESKLTENIDEPHRFQTSQEYVSMELPQHAACVGSLVDRLMEEKTNLSKALEREKEQNARLMKDTVVLRDLLKERNLLMLELQEAKEELERKIFKAEEAEESAFISLKLQAEGFPLDRRELYNCVKQLKEQWEKDEKHLQRLLADERAENQLLKMALAEEVEFEKEACKKDLEKTEQRMSDERKRLENLLVQLNEKNEQLVLERDNATQRAMVAAFSATLKDEEIRNKDLELAKLRSKLEQVGSSASPSSSRPPNTSLTVKALLAGRRVEFLESQLKEMISHCKCLEGMVEQAKFSVTHYRKKNAKLESHNKILKTTSIELSTAAEQAEEFKARCETMSQQLEEAEAQLQALVEQEAFWTSRYEELSGEVISLRAKVKELKDANMQLSTAVVAEPEPNIESSTQTDLSSEEQQDQEAVDWEEECIQAQVQVDVLHERLRALQEEKEQEAANYKVRIEHLERCLNRRDQMILQQVHASQAVETELSKTEESVIQSLVQGGYERKLVPKAPKHHQLEEKEEEEQKLVF